MKSKNNIEQFDDFFKESLENASVKAPSGVFENVATQIGSNAATTAAAVVAKSVVIKVVAAVVVATVAAIGVYKYNAVEEKNALSIEQETIVENAPVVENEIEGIESVENLTEKDDFAKEYKLDESGDNLVLDFKRKANGSANIDSDSPNDKKNESITTGSNTPIIIEDKDDSDADQFIKTDEYADLIAPNQIEVATIAFDNLKEEYCKGETLNLALEEGFKGVTWKLNNVLIGSGNSLQYELKSKGAKKIEIYSGNSFLGMRTFIVNAPNTNFQVLDQNGGTYILDPMQKDAEYIWNLNDASGYRKTGEANLGMVDYNRATIPVTLIVKTNQGCIDSIKQNITNKYIANEECLKHATSFALTLVM